MCEGGKKWFGYLNILDFRYMITKYRTHCFVRITVLVKVSGTCVAICLHLPLASLIAQSVLHLLLFQLLLTSCDSPGWQKFKLSNVNSCSVDRSFV